MKFTFFNIYSLPLSTCQIDSIQEPIYRKTIIGGDFNAHSPQWRYIDTNGTGQYVEELRESTNLVVLQDTDSPAALLHRVHNTLSRPDLTIVSSDLKSYTTFRILSDIGSDHKPLLIYVTLTGNAKPQQKNKPRCNFRKANWSKYKHVKRNFRKVT